MANDTTTTTHPDAAPDTHPSTSPTPTPAPSTPTPQPGTTQPGTPTSTPSTQPTPSVQASDPLSLHYGSSQPGEGVLLTPSQRAMAGPQAEQTTVKMEVLRDGSFNGEYRKVGDSIDVNADQVETLTLSGFAARADRAQLAEQARADDQARRDALKNRRGGRSTSTAPLGTRDLGGTPTEPR